MRHVRLDRLGREVQLRRRCCGSCTPRSISPADLALAVREGASTPRSGRAARRPWRATRRPEPPQLERGLVVQTARLLVSERRGERDGRLARPARDGERLSGEQVRAGRVEHVARLVGMAGRGARGLGGAGRLSLREQDRRAGALGLARCGREARARTPPAARPAPRPRRPGDARRGAAARTPAAGPA